MRHRLGRIDDDILDDLLDLRLVQQKSGRSSSSAWQTVTSCADRNAFINCSERLIRPFSVDRAHFRRRRARELQKLAGHAVQPVDFLDDDVQELAVLRHIIRRQLVAQKLGGAFDGGERVAQLMGDVGGELPGFGQLADPLHFSFHLHFVGDVLEDDDDAQLFARLAFELGGGQVDVRLVALRRPVAELVAREDLARLGASAPPCASFRPARLLRSAAGWMNSL